MSTAQRLTTEQAAQSLKAADAWYEGVAARATAKSLTTSQYARLFIAGEDVDGLAKGGHSDRPYKQVALVYTCINKILTTIKGLPLVLSTADDRIIESGPAWDVLYRNPLMSWVKFVTETIGHFLISGDVFWVFDPPGGRPRSVQVISGTQMYPITSTGRADGELTGWEFRPGGGRRIGLSLDEVHQWKNYNPYDKFHGLSPLDAARLHIDYSYSATMFNASALANGAEPGIILRAAGAVTPEQTEMLRSQFNSRHKGPDKAKRTAVLSGGMDLDTVAMNMVDMAVAELTQMSDKKICSAFGVPPGVVGLVTEAQYSHGPAQEDFIFNTILPLAGAFASEITAGILSRFFQSDHRSVTLKQSQAYRGRSIGLHRKAGYRTAAKAASIDNREVFAWFDGDDHPTVAAATRNRTDQVLKHTERGVPLNQVIDAHDLPYQPVAWGDTWLVPMGLVPAETAIEGGEELAVGESLPEGESEDRSVAKTEPETRDTNDQHIRLRIWKNWVASWQPIEREYRQAVRTLFIRQQRILIEYLKDAYESESRAVKDPNDIVRRVVFDLQIEDEKLKKINVTFFEKGAELGARQVLTEMAGLESEALDEAAERIMNLPAIKRSLTISSQKVKKVNRTTQKRIAEQLGRGLESGEGLNQLADRIKTTLGGNRKRALGIARTQTAGAVGSGRHEGHKSAGVEKKSWVDSKDDAVRRTHKAAAVRYAEGIDIDIPFQVGSSMLMYPGDPNGEAGEIIHCRCVEIARKVAGKTIELSSYAGSFYSYHDMQRDKSKAKSEKYKEPRIDTD